MCRSLSILLAFVLLPFTRALAEDNGIKWQPWSDSVFAQAKREGRFVLLDLGTVWCHWCHVMEEVTYRDPTVIELVSKRYLAVRVDADARPDLSNRYEDYGWPATIVFNSDGERDSETARLSASASRWLRCCKPSLMTRRRVPR